MTRKERQLKATAFHEAGHVVAAIVLGLPLRRATITPEGQSLGHVLHQRAGKWFRPDLVLIRLVQVRVEHHAISSLAGRAAERLLTGRWNHVGARTDYDQALDILSFICSSPEQLSLYFRLMDLRARALVDLCRVQIERIAAGLLEQKTLREPELRALFFGTLVVESKRRK